MKKRKIRENIFWIGAVDWDRRLFDSLIPLPDGTSYNAYLIKGSEKTVLLDTVDPLKTEILMYQLKDIDKIDYIVSHHAEQDHSGSIPMVLNKYPDAKIICTQKCKEMLIDHLALNPEVFITVNDGEELSLGDKKLRFVHTPWVHWPETMSTYLYEDKILFSCDFFGSHLASTDLYVTDNGIVYEAAKRYYSEIMMPFRRIIQKNLQKVDELDIELIAPSHGPIYDDPSFIVDAYKDWVDEMPKNEVVIPYETMHGSTGIMVDYLTSLLAERGIKVHRFQLSAADIGKLAITLVDAATIIIGTPTVHTGVHPLVHYGAYLVNILRPKLKFASIIGSYGWNSKAVEQTAGLIPNLKVEIISPVLCKGHPNEETFRALETLADTVADKHKQLGLFK